MDLIKKFLDKVIPTLNQEDSIDDSLNNMMNEERAKEIENYAKDINMDYSVLQDIIDEYEYSGIFPNEMVSQAIHAPFIEKINLIENVKLFIKNLIRKYM